MSAYLVLLIAALSRFFPHLLHGVGLNVTAVGGGLLFFGARRPRREALVAAAVMALTDVCLTVAIFHDPFHLRSYLATWVWYAAVPLLGGVLLRRGADQRRAEPAVRAALGVLGSASSFFLLSNFVVWAQGAMYPHTAAGLGACYRAGVPFYANDLASTAFTLGALLGVPALARELHKAVGTSEHRA